MFKQNLRYSSAKVAFNGINVHEEQKKVFKYLFKILSHVLCDNFVILCNIKSYSE